MLTVPGYETVSTIYLGPKTGVYRAIRQQDQCPVVLKALISSTPSIGDLGRYRYSYSITKDLDIKGVCRMYDLLESQQRPVLVMEDIGGTSVRLLFGKGKLEGVVPVINTMLKVAEALHQFHQKNLVHRDLKPSNVIMAESGDVQLVDFDLASRLTREAPEAWNPRMLQGTPAYISPEQTGRMNRVIDHRTDLYSLGVMFFELLTGRLPFEDTDTMALLHSHIAVPPPAVHELAREVPSILNDIVQKLLAKTPETRYQSALGLRYDLETFLKEYQEKNDCEPFPLAQTDISPRLQPSQRLYGRNQEIGALMDTFTRVSHGSTEALMVAGYSGIGKSSLVREVHKPIVRAKGRFASGKFDQLQNIPYAGLLQALQQLLEDILTEPEEELAYWRQVITHELGNIAQVVVDVVPALELLIGPQPPAPQMSMLEAQNRFQRTITKFIRVFATEEHPLTLFLDDLQWARNNTLQLLKQVLTDPDMHHLFVLGAYRDNEVDETHPLWRVLQELEELNTPLTKLQLAPLSLEDTNEFIADSLNLEHDQTTELSESIYSKTQGNPFFAGRFLLAIHDEGLLQFDPTARRWQWQIERIKSMQVAENVLDLMKQKMAKLPEETQEYLHLASCIGNQFDLETLIQLSGQDKSIVAKALWPAMEEEFILPLTDAYRYVDLFASDAPLEEGETLPNIAYKILHDKLQEAAYSMKPEAERKATHLRLGRLLLERFDEDEREEHFFDVVNHWNQGVDLLELAEEQLALAKMNQHAGRKAMDAAAFVMSHDYFNIGLSLLPDNAWSEHHQLTFDLHRYSAETGLMVGNFDKSIALEGLMLEHASDLRERTVTHQQRMRRILLNNDIYGTQQAGLEALELLFDFSRPQTDEEWGEAAAAEMGEIAKYLEEKEVMSLADLPMIEDGHSPIAQQMNLLVNLFPSAASDPKILMVVVPRLIRLSLTHGYIPDAPIGYASYALMQSAGGQYELADAFGKLAIALAEKFETLRRQPAVLMVYGCWIAHWCYPLDQAIGHARQAVIDGLENGIFDWAGWSSMNLPWLMMARGAPLEQVLQQTSENHKLARATLLYDDAANSAAGSIHALFELMGETEAQETFSKEFGDIDTLLEKLSHYPMAVMQIVVHQLMVASILGDWERALEQSEIAKPLIPLAAGLIGASEFYFYRTLTLLALKPTVDEETWATYLEEIEANKVLLDKFAASGPDNHLYKKLFIEAELALLKGDHFLASERYDETVDAAEKQRFHHIEGLALERAAIAYQQRGKRRVARSYKTDARFAYVRWGAQKKVSQMEVLNPNLTSQRGTSRHQSTKGTTVSGGHAILDVQAIMRASQALSEEILLPELLKKVMVTVIENAGAQRGLLLLQQQNNWYIEAQIDAEGQSPNVMDHIPMEEGELSASVVRFVERSRESLVLNNAQESSRFGYDPYIVKHNIRSLLCTPIIHQSKLIGVLYLENNLVTNAFTDERCTTLEMISTQAAISIENAQLYASVEEKVEERTMELREAYEKLQSTQTQLVQSEKMASLGTLVAGVAHEINNPANFTHSGSQNLMRRMEDLRSFILEAAGGDENPEAAELFESKFAPIFSNLSAIVDGTQRIKGIVRDLRTFSRLDESEQKEADLIAGLNSTLSLVKANYQEQVEFLASHEKKEITMDCWPAQLNQVFMNIMVNACQAIASRRDSDPTAPEGQLSINSTIHSDDSGKHLHITFQDNGCGMPKTVRERIFEPFFTTRAVGSGTGLGLSISYGIIEKHGGKIDVTSSPGHGTTFVIQLPMRA